MCRNNLVWIALLASFLALFHKDNCAVVFTVPLSVLLKQDLDWRPPTTISLSRNIGIGKKERSEEVTLEC